MRTLSEAIVPIQVHTEKAHDLTALEPQLYKRVTDLLNAVKDPELPMLSIQDLGILRDLGWSEDKHLVVKISPTYSGCPAVQAIRESILEQLEQHGFSNVHVVEQLSPAWTSEWMSDRGKAALKEHGIAAPLSNACSNPVPSSGIECPQCNSTQTNLLTEFGSTACKAMYNCNACFETFDYFKAF